jgi:hypothetical protein
VQELAPDIQKTDDMDALLAEAAKPLFSSQPKKENEYGICIL